MSMDQHACIPGCFALNRRLLDYTAGLDDCWLTRHGRDGYTRVAPIYGEQLGHRIAWVVWHDGESIPRGYDIHHRCGHKSCVNPRHLEMLTRADHHAIHAPPTSDTPPSGECRHGHLWAEWAKFTTQGRWACVICQREAVRRYDAKRRPKQRAA